MVDTGRLARNVAVLPEASAGAGRGSERHARRRGAAGLRPPAAPLGGGCGVRSGRSAPQLSTVPQLTLYIILYYH